MSVSYTHLDVYKRQMLHLFGYDHIKEDEREDMENKQNIILNNLGITREI